MKLLKKMINWFLPKESFIENDGTCYDETDEQLITAFDDYSNGHWNSKDRF